MVSCQDERGKIKDKAILLPLAFESGVTRMKNEWIIFLY